MRSATIAEFAILAAERYVTHTRVLITNADNVDVDLSSYLASVEIAADIDQPIVQPRISLHREGEAGSLSPLVEDSPLNRRANTTFAPLLDAGRRVQVHTASTLPAVAPEAGDWKLIFDGVIDEVEWQADPLLVLARDPGGALQDRQIEEAQEYGSEAGVPLEVVMQQLLDDTLGAGAVTLHVPASPGFTVTAYQPEEGPLFEALQALADVVGWDVRYAWHEGSQSFRLTLLEPDREKAAPDHTHGPDRYIDVSRLSVARDGVRNVVEVRYHDAGTHQVERVTVHDQASIDRYGRRYMRLPEEADSPIDTSAEALRMAEAALADLKDPKAEQEIELRYWWPVELGDLYRFEANGDHYTTDQELAVIGYRHRLTPDQQRTVLICRGRPAGGYRTWHKRAAAPPDASVELYAQCWVNQVDTYPDRLVLEVTAEPGYGQVWLDSIEDAELITGPAEGIRAPSGSQWEIRRPAPEAGQGLATFGAEAPTYVPDLKPVVIAQQGRDTVPLAMRATVVGRVGDEITIRVAVADPLEGAGLPPHGVLVSFVAENVADVQVPGTGFPGIVGIPPDELTADFESTGYVEYVVTRKPAGQGPGSITWTATAPPAGGGPHLRVQASDTQAISDPIVLPVLYAECQARITDATAAEVTVTVDAVPAGAQVELLASSTASRSSGPDPGEKSPSGTVWKFTRPAALTNPTEARFRATLTGYESDDDHTLIPEAGRDTVPLTLRARQVDQTALTRTVRVSVGDPRHADSSAPVTISYVQQGAASVTPASGQTIPASAVRATPGATEGQTGGFVDFTISRPGHGTGGGRVVFTATRTGRVQDSDPVDVPELPAEIPPQSFDPIAEIENRGLDAGHYVFRLTARDWQGGTAGLEYRRVYYYAHDGQPGWDFFSPMSGGTVDIEIPPHPKYDIVLAVQVKDAAGRVVNRTDRAQATMPGIDGLTGRLAANVPLSDGAFAARATDSAGTILPSESRVQLAGAGAPSYSLAVSAEQAHVPSQNMLSENARNEVAVGPAPATVNILAETPVEVLGLLPGDVYSISCEARFTGGAHGSGAVRWQTPGGEVYHNMQGPIGSSYARHTLEAAVVPPGATSVLVYGGNGAPSGTAFFRRWMWNRGPVALPFEEPPFRYQRDRRLPAATVVDGDLWVPDADVVRIGRDGDPRTVRKVLRIPHTSLVVRRNSPTGLRHDTEFSSPATVVPGGVTAVVGLLLPRGVTIVKAAVYMHRSDLSSNAVATLWRTGTSGTPLGIPITNPLAHTGLGWQYVSEAASELVDDHLYSFTINMVDAQTLDGTRVSYFEIEYLVPDYLTGI